MLKLGRFLDIDVSLHWTLLLLVGWTAFTSPIGSPFASAALISAMFACVLAHEFGHSLAARQFGIGTTSINLFPIGGVATLARMPREPMQELWIAVAGPLVNVVIASLLFLLRGPALFAFGEQLFTWLTFLMYANIGLVVFNLLPAFPMDGGRIFRALAATVLPYVQATNLAANVGKVVAVGLGLVGLLQGHFMLMLIAGFVFFVGSAEARAVAEEFREQTLPHVGRHVVRAVRNGRKVLAVWDESLQAYRIFPVASGV